MSGAAGRWRLVLLGAGHAHAVALRHLGAKPAPDLDLTLLTPSARTPYSGMVPGVVAGRYRREEAEIDVARLARFAGAALRLDAAVGLDLAKRHVLCRDGPPVPFELLSIDVGAAPALPDGASGHAVPVKPVAAFLDRFDRLEAAVANRPARLAVVGTGLAGAELALALRHRFPRAAVTLVGRAPAVAPELGGRARARLERALRRRRVGIVTGFSVGETGDGRLVAADGRAIEVDATLWVTGSLAPPWLAASGLAVDAAGFVSVDEALRSRSHPFVFAAGDVAALPDSRPKAGVFAVREGRVLAGNFRRAATGRPLEAYRPQADWLRLLSYGDGRGVAVRGGWHFEGRLAWGLKSWIDRRFVAGFNRLTI